MDVVTLSLSLSLSLAHKFLGCYIDAACLCLSAAMLAASAKFNFPPSGAFAVAEHLTTDAINWMI